MLIHIQGRNLSVTDEVRAHVERRLHFALGACCRQVKRILVRLSDINGPRGGNDKRCHVEVVLAGQAVVVEKTDADVYLAVGRAASTASRTVMRRLGRRRDIRRNGTVPDRTVSEGIA
jgi:putative sigma-54 modulation protein